MRVSAGLAPKLPYSYNCDGSCSLMSKRRTGKFYVYFAQMFYEEIHVFFARSYEFGPVLKVSYNYHPGYCLCSTVEGAKYSGGFPVQWRPILQYSGGCGVRWRAIMQYSGG